MLKRFVTLFGLLLLTSCILVEDANTPFVASHVVVDSKLLGEWKPVQPTDRRKVKPQEAAIRYTVTEKNRVLTATIKTGYSSTPAMSGIQSFWTLKFEQTNFAYSPQSRQLFKYQILDNVLTIYSLNARTTPAFLQKNHPKLEKIRLSDVEKDNGRFMIISTLDEEVAKVLVEMGRHSELWGVVRQFHRPPPPKKKK